MYVGGDQIKGFNTTVAEAEPMSWYLDPAIWSGALNFVVVIALSFVFSDKIPDNLKVNTDKHSGEEGKLLTMTDIDAAMAKTQEPIMMWSGRGLCLATMLLVCIPLPYYGASYNNCNIGTYPDSYVGKLLGMPQGDCTAGVFVGGIPQWAFICIIFYIFAILTCLGTWFLWKTDDSDQEEAAKDGVVSTTEPAVEPMKSITVEATIKVDKV